jgi:hypothetical protein
VVVGVKLRWELDRLTFSWITVLCSVNPSLNYKTLDAISLLPAPFPPTKIPPADIKVTGVTGRLHAE